MLNAGADVDCTDDQGWTALHLAAYAGSNEVVRILIDAGSDINALVDRPEGSPLKNSPLHLAAKNGQIEVVRTLASTPGIDRDAVDYCGYTALHCAAFTNAGHIIAILLQHGWAIDARSDHGSTPLLTAAFRNCIDAARALVEGGADLNLRDQDGSTVLDLARRNPHNPNDCPSSTLR